LFSTFQQAGAHLPVRHERSISPDAATTLVELHLGAVALLESDLIMISGNGAESEEDITAFKQRYPFASRLQRPRLPNLSAQTSARVNSVISGDEARRLVRKMFRLRLRQHLSLRLKLRQSQCGRWRSPAEVLEFLFRKQKSHLQVVTHCLLSLETNPTSEQVHRLLRAMHTVKGWPRR